MVYEEPVEALSDSFRAKMGEALREHFDEATLFVIASSRSTVLDFDKVLLLNEKSEIVSMQVPSDLKNGPGAILGEQLLAEMDSRILKQASSGQY